MKKIITLIIAAIASFSLISAPTYAACSQSQLENGCVNTSILGENGCSCDDGQGSSIIHILDLVIDIMTIGIGILGVVGISIVGIQYLTAGGNEEQTKKAKRRLLEIVIGLVVYAVFYAILTFFGINRT